MWRIGRNIPLTSLCIVLCILCFLSKAHSVWGDDLTFLHAEDTDYPNDAPASLPTLEETRNAILKLSSSEDGSYSDDGYPDGCYNNGNNVCIQAHMSAVRLYLRSLAARVEHVAESSIDLEDKTLQEKLTKLGCMSIAIIDLAEVHAIVGLFKQGIVSRIHLDHRQLEFFSGKCNGKLFPIIFHQAEHAHGMRQGGHLNRRRECSEQNTGGHHDPGFACGPKGSTLCKDLSIPASSALQGLPTFNGAYHCTPQIYNIRPFACHAGDLSGKLGAKLDLSPDKKRRDLKLLEMDIHGDSPCVAAENHNSLVLQCESTEARIACAPFQKIETAGKQIPALMREMIRTALLSLPQARSQRSLLASLLLVRELERRLDVLEGAPPRTPDAEDDKPPSEEGEREPEPALPPVPIPDDLI